MEELIFGILRYSFGEPATSEGLWDCLEFLCGRIHLISVPYTDHKTASSNSGVHQTIA